MSEVSVAPPPKEVRTFRVGPRRDKSGGRHRMGRSSQVRSIHVTPRPNHKERDVESMDLIRAGLGAIRVGEKVGEGGQGVVAKGTDNDASVAVKVSNPKKEYSRRALKREGRLHRTLDKHPYIVGPRGARRLRRYRRGEEFKVHAVLTDFAEGGSLDEVMETKKHFSIGEAAAISAQIASALEATHAKGLVHRDIKPANIFVKDATGDIPKVALGDFGLARPPGETEGLQLTLPYGAPEQFASRFDYTTDIYSLGAVLYELETGELLFSDEKMGFPDDYQIARIIMISNPTRYNEFIQSRLEGIRTASPETAQLLEDMLHINPYGRPDATTVKDRLTAISSQYSGQADKVLTSNAKYGETVSLETL